MSLRTQADPAADGYEPVALSQAAAGCEAGPSMPAFLRRSARASRRAVLFLHDLGGTFRPADLARWFTDRGFHFYVAGLDPELPPGAAGPWLDAARAYLSGTGGIDALIVCAHGSAAPAAALWCAASRDAEAVHALILSSPVFGRALRRSLDIACPVLVIWADGAASGPRQLPDAARLGGHITTLHLPSDLAAGPPQAADRHRLFDEMGRWLGAYMYGRLHDRDRLL